MTLPYSEELKVRSRFPFGANWLQFLKVMDDGRVYQSEHSLCKMLKTEDLKGKRFLDVGSGSGLFSLAARRLGATVHSFDYDPESVACTKELKERHFPNDPDWMAEHGSVLDKMYLATLGLWDVVYSWGVLHHTGDMYQALDNVSGLVCADGKLFIAIYNNQGRTSGHWLKVNKSFNRLPHGFQWLVLWPAMLRLWGPTTLRELLSGGPFILGGITPRTVPVACRRGEMSLIGLAVSPLR